MNTIEPLTTKMIQPDPSSHIAVSLFCSILFFGFYYLDLWKKNIAMQTKIITLDENVSALHTKLDEFIQEQEDVVLEQSHRLREKKDYDESDEVEEYKYQAWKGFYDETSRKMEITIWREKTSTIRKNQEWVAWDGENDGSCTVRDFYLGNGSPTFEWSFEPIEGMFRAKVNDIMVNGWDSLIKIDITFTLPSRESLLDFLSEKYYNGSPTLNTALQKLVKENKIKWSRVLIDAD